MAVYRTYQCPSCEGKFDFLHHPNDEPPPDFCPLCGSNVSGKKKSRIKKIERINSPGLSERIKRMPGPRRTASKSADMVYRRMENASNERMQEAAEVLGVSESSLSEMKLTNMKDNMREGDISQSTAPSDATKLTGSSVPTVLPDSGGTGQRSVFNPFQGNGAEAIANAKGAGTYAAPTGVRNISMINSLHSAQGSRIVAAGRMNKKG